MATEVKIRLTKKDIWTIPNILSYFRILLIPVIILCYLYVENPWVAVGVIVVSGLTDAAARRANVLGVYEAVSLEWIHGKRILLVDDI